MKLLKYNKIIFMNTIDYMKIFLFKCTSIKIIYKYKNV